MYSQAVILAGGLGTRLMPLTKDIPKPMVSVSGKPFLYWQLRYLQAQGVSEAVLLISHLGHVIEKYFEENPIAGLRVRFSREPEPCGTGGALALALGMLAPRFWLINGDSFLPLDLNSMGEYCENRNCLATIASLSDLSLVPVPGNLRLEGEVVAAYKKNGGNENGYVHVDSGVYLISRTVIEQGPTGRFDLEAYWPKLIATRSLGVFPIAQRFYDIGTPERLKFFEDHLHDYF